MSSGTSRAHAEELRREQTCFDIARNERERLRARLMSDSTIGAADQWAAQAIARARRKNGESMGSPDDSVAFGRIDIVATLETFYVGNRIIEADGVTVLNWRARAAEPYYRATVGDTMGLGLRRKFETSRNRVLSFEDEVFADIKRRVDALDEPPAPTTDDALLRSLEGDRSTEMRDIAKTIQASQYEIMAAPANGALIVQGGAGTGKTAVALHRVSWLLYRERDRMSPEDVLVIGPSDRFNQFIRSVLPSLGDAGVQHGDLLSMGPVPSSGVEEESAARVKGDVRMAEVLRRALYDRVQVVTDSSGFLVVGEGGSVARFTRQELEVPLRQFVEQSSYERGRRQLRQWLSTQSSMRTRSRTAVNGRLIDAVVERMWPAVTAREVLTGLLGSLRLLRRCAADLLTEEEIAAIHRTSRRPSGQDRWSKADVALLDELWSLLEGRQKTYKHVVVDEAQDLSAMQWRSVLRRCGDGSCTLVGDVAQSTGPFARHSWADVEEHFRAGGPVTVSELHYGYRVPRQVFDLAARLLPIAAPGVSVPTSVRQGPSGPEFRCVSPDSLVHDAARGGEDLVESGQFVAVIAEESTLGRIAGELRRRSVRFDEHSTDAGETGLTLLTPVQSKGLEFDAVVLVEPAAIAGDEVAGIRELYIALTRTTRHLQVVHSRAFDLLDLPEWTDPVPAGSDGTLAVLEPAELLTVAVRVLEMLPLEDRERFVADLSSELGLMSRSVVAEAPSHAPVVVEPSAPAEHEQDRPKRRLWTGGRRG